MNPEMLALPTARFVLRVDDEWVPVDMVPPAEWLAHLDRLDRVTCCTLQGGFSISADGKPWNEEAIDEIRMASTWLPAVQNLLDGQLVQQVWAWEESQMTLLRSGDLVELQDVHHSGQIVCPRVVFGMEAFARALVQAAQRWLAFRDAVLQSLGEHRHAETLRENLSDDWAGSVQAVLDRLGRPIPAAPQGAVLPDPPLHRAVLLDDQDGCRKLLRQRPLDLEQPRGLGHPDTALHLAVERRRHAMVVTLLEAGASVNARGDWGDTPLHRAAQRAVSTDIVNTLLGAGARLESLDDKGWTPLQRASLAGLYPGTRTELAELLLAAGAKLDLVSALALGRFESAEELIASEPIPNDAIPLLAVRMHYHLHHAAREGREQEVMNTHLAVLDRVLGAGANLHDVGAVFSTPALHQALLGGNAALVRVLLERGADPARVDRRGNTARDIVAQYHLDAMAPLLDGTPPSLDPSPPTQVG